MNTLNTLSLAQLKRAVAIKEQIAQLEQELTSLSGGSVLKVPAAKPAPTKGGISAAGIARIRAANKARWAKIKGPTASKAAPAAKATSAPKPAKKFTMSAAAKAKISAAATARWARIKAAKGK